MEEKRHVFSFTVDGEPFETHEHVLTPRMIMSLAGVDPDIHYLVLVEGRQQKSFEGRPNEEIHMRNHMKFLTVSTGPTPVS